MIHVRLGLCEGESRERLFTRAKARYREQTRFRVPANTELRFDTDAQSFYLAQVRPAFRYYARIEFC